MWYLVPTCFTRRVNSSSSIIWLVWTRTTTKFFFCYGDLSFKRILNSLLCQCLTYFPSFDFFLDSSESGSTKGGIVSRTSSSGKVSGGDGKPTRVRTVLNEKQLHTLRTCYNANPRPDALMKEQLVEMTSLSPRVIRVWFQNKRCKDKKRAIAMKQQLQQEKVSTFRVHQEILLLITSLLCGSI